MKKLVLKKEVVARINEQAMQKLKGGVGASYDGCTIQSNCEATVCDGSCITCNQDTCAASCGNTCAPSCVLTCANGCYDPDLTMMVHTCLQSNDLYCIY